MNKLIEFMDKKPVWATAVLIVAAVAMIGYVIGNGVQYDTLNFVPISYDSIVDLLTPVFLIALFLERAVEVFVATGRKLARADKEVAVTKAKSKIAQLNTRVEVFQKTIGFDDTKSPTPDERNEVRGRITNVWDALPDAQRAERTAQAALDRYRSKTGRITFVVAALLGLIVGLAGLRVIAPLVDFQLANWGNFQTFLFHSIDVVFTAGLLAGGASGIHQIIRVFGDFTEQTRKKVQP